MYSSVSLVRVFIVAYIVLLGIMWRTIALPYSLVSSPWFRIPVVLGTVSLYVADPVTGVLLLCLVLLTILASERKRVSAEAVPSSSSKEPYHGYRGRLSPHPVEEKESRASATDVPEKVIRDRQARRAVEDLVSHVISTGHAKQKKEDVVYEEIVGSYAPLSVLSEGGNYGSRHAGGPAETRPRGGGDVRPDGSSLLSYREMGVDAGAMEAMQNNVFEPGNMSLYYGDTGIQGVYSDGTAPVGYSRDIM